MRKVAFFAQKGGAGKTTLATQVAVTAQQAKESVVLIDTDPQQSATHWGEVRGFVRELPTPVVVSVAVSALAEALKAAKTDGMTLAIIDTAPHAAAEAAQVVRSAQLSVVPVRPTALDIAALSRSIAIIRAAQTPAGLVLSA